MRICTCCNKELPLSEYYKNKSWHVRKCKDCTREYIRSRSKLPKVQEYNRNRPNAEERRKQSNQITRLRYKNDPDYRLERSNKQKEDRARNKKKYLARRVINNGIVAGNIIAKTICEKCGIESALHAHHEDYDKPLEVIWLCVNCHARRHRELNEIKRRIIQ